MPHNFDIISGGIAQEEILYIYFLCMGCFTLAFVQRRRSRYKIIGLIRRTSDGSRDTATMRRTGRVIAPSALRIRASNAYAGKTVV